jgi:hypothetical protein
MGILDFGFWILDCPERGAQAPPLWHFALSGYLYPMDKDACKFF